MKLVALAEPSPALSRWPWAITAGAHGVLPRRLDEARQTANGLLGLVGTHDEYVDAAQVLDLGLRHFDAQQPQSPCKLELLLLRAELGPLARNAELRDFVRRDPARERLLLHVERGRGETAELRADGHHAERHDDQRDHDFEQREARAAFSVDTCHRVPS